MKVRINKKILETLNPCKHSMEHGLKFYKKFDGDILEFLALDKITPVEKIWVCTRILPRELVEVFAIDCSFAATAYASEPYADAAAFYAANVTDPYANAAAYVVYASAASSAAAYAAAASAASAYAASAYAAVALESKRQLDALAYLVNSW